MIYVCVICMVKRPPLSALSPEHRTLLEAIVSPVIKTEELKDWHWLHCADCKILMQSVYNFQQTALAGVKNLKHLFCELNKAVNITAGAYPKVRIRTPKPVHMPVLIKKEENLKVPFKIEPEPEVIISSSKKETITATASRSADPLTVEVNVKSEPESCSEPDPEPECDSDATLSCGSDHDAPSTRSTTYISAPSTVTVKVISKLPEPVKGDDGVKCDVFTHGPRQKQRRLGRCELAGPYLTSIRWKGGVGEPLRIRKKYKPARASCPHCGRNMEKGKIKSHIARMHAESATCECDVCGKQCRNEFALKAHKTYKHNEKADPAAFCVQCNMQYRDIAQYEKHLRTSTRHATESDFRFKCDECGRKFITEANLQKHSKIHTGAEYPCDQCGQTFKSKPGWRFHVRTKHEGKLLPRNKLCDHCGKGFPDKAQLLSHVNSHTGARPFVCKLCGADFGHKSALYLHGRYKHKIPRKKEKVINKTCEKDHSEKSSVDIVKDQEDTSSLSTMDQAQP